MADALTEQFRSLGVNDPDGWARSQQSEGIDQISRATLLRALADIIADAPYFWNGQTGPHAADQVRLAAARIAASDVSPDDLALVLQATTWEVVFSILSLLDSASEPEINPADLSFGVFALDEDGSPLDEPLMLAESWREVAAAVLGPEVITP